MSYSKLNLACVSDSAYLTYAIGLFLSAQRHLKNFTLHIKTVNAPAQNWFTTKPNVVVYPCTSTASHTDLTDRVEYDNDFLQHFDVADSPKVTSLMSFTNNIRFEFASQLLESGVDNVVLLDADMLINKDISHLIYSVDHIAIQPYFEGLETRYCAEFMFIKNTPETRRFFKTVATQLPLEFGLYKWGHAKFLADQLHAADYLKKLLVSDFYRDSAYRISSYIWTGEDYRKHQKLCQQLHQTGYLDRLNLYLRDEGLSCFDINK